MDCPANINAVGNWNQNNQGNNWNQWKIKEAPWRDNPCYRWSDGSQNPQLQITNSEGNQGSQSNWSGRKKDMATGIKEDRVIGAMEVKEISPAGTIEIKITREAHMYPRTRGTTTIRDQGISTTITKEVEETFARIKGVDQIMVKGQVEVNRTLGPRGLWMIWSMT